MPHLPDNNDLVYMVAMVCLETQYPIHTTWIWDRTSTPLLYSNRFHWYMFRADTETGCLLWFPVDSSVQLGMDLLNCSRQSAGTSDRHRMVCSSVCGLSLCRYYTFQAGTVPGWQLVLGCFHPDNNGRPDSQYIVWHSRYLADRSTYQWDTQTKSQNLCLQDSNTLWGIVSMHLNLMDSSHRLGTSNRKMVQFDSWARCMCQRDTEIRSSSAWLQGSNDRSYKGSLRSQWHRGPGSKIQAGSWCNHSGRRIRCTCCMYHVDTDGNLCRRNIHHEDTNLEKMSNGKKWKKFNDLAFQIIENDIYKTFICFSAKTFTSGRGEGGCNYNHSRKCWGNFLKKNCTTGFSQKK